MKEEATTTPCERCAHLDKLARYTYLAHVCLSPIPFVGIMALRFISGFWYKKIVERGMNHGKTSLS